MSKDTLAKIADLDSIAEQTDNALYVINQLTNALNSIDYEFKSSASLLQDDEIEEIVNELMSLNKSAEMISHRLIAVVESKTAELRQKE